MTERTEHYDILKAVDSYYEDLPSFDWRDHCTTREVINSLASVLDQRCRDNGETTIAINSAWLRTIANSEPYVGPVDALSPEDRAGYELYRLLYSESFAEQYWISRRGSSTANHVRCKYNKAAAFAIRELPAILDAT